VHRPDRTRPGHRQPIADKLRGIGCGRVGYAQVAVDRSDQPPQPVPIQLILPAQIRQHLCLRHRADARLCASWTYRTTEPSRFLRCLVRKYMPYLIVLLVAALLVGM
jgi:hypothetical protein